MGLVKFGEFCELVWRNIDCLSGNPVALPGGGEAGGGKRWKSGWAPKPLPHTLPLLQSCKGPEKNQIKRNQIENVKKCLINVSINTIQRIIGQSMVNVCLLYTVILFYFICSCSFCSPLSGNCVTVTGRKVTHTHTHNGKTLLVGRARGSFDSGNFTWVVVGAVGWLP